MRGASSGFCARVFAAGLVVAIAWAGGCQSTPPKTGGGAAATPKSLPSIKSVVESQDARVRGLDSLWARVSLRVDGRLANATLNKEEAEGYLQVILPAKVAVSINKLGNTYFYLGSNDELYWWFDLTGDKVAFFGRHAKATPETVDRFGIPVHPLDLIELMAITPVPLPGQPGGPENLHWSTDGTLLWYDAPARGSTKRVLVDPQSLLPVMVELLDNSEKVVVRSELSKYVAFQSHSVVGATPSVPSRCIIKVPRQDLTITINLNDPGNRTAAGRPINPAAFDFIKLNQSFPVTKLIDLDKRESADGTEPPTASDGENK